MVSSSQTIRQERNLSLKSPSISHYLGADSSADQRDGKVQDGSAEKRRCSEDSTSDAPAPKKITMSLGSKTTLANQKLSFSLGGAGTGQAKSGVSAADKPMKISVAPIKMSLNPVQKTKEPPPVVQKSAQAAKVFDDSSDDSEDEMPPEARMRMKNIGRDTPTASGPNSYGKGKQGFVDRHKIIEKQLKEEMENVSGDKVIQKP